MITSKPLSLILCFALSLTTTLLAQKPISHIAPPNWYVGFEKQEFQVLLYGDSLPIYTSVHIESEKVSLVGETYVPNKKYKILTLSVSPSAKPEKFTITLKGEGKLTLKVPYELKARKTEAETPLRGLSQADIIYLAMPDRFANGNPDNDVISGMNQTTVDRSKPFERHGGDLAGVTKNLEFIKELGMTALWLNPIETNDQPKESYHGYAITNHYEVDPRLGDLEDFRDMVKKAHSLGIKVVKDIVYNHFGNEHWMIKDLPDPSWVHQWENFTKTTYRSSTLVDPYASEYDKKIFSEGWFDTHMPDLNQKVPALAEYLIQYTIWWIEEFGLDALRIDTHAYPDQVFMATLLERLKNEFPRLFVFGEVWVHHHTEQAWFTELNGLNKNFNNHNYSITDFVLHYAMNAGFNEGPGWNEGMMRLYTALAGDVLYNEPHLNVTFLDNHDVGRFLNTVGNDVEKLKLALTFMLTTRGIPSIFYGTELGWNYHENHGAIRADFPGGWKGDKVNKFNTKNLKGVEKELFNHIATLSKLRQTSALGEGALKHFVPEDNVYVYFRFNQEETYMVVLNSNNEAKTVGLTRFAENIRTAKKGTDALTNKELSLEKDLTIGAKSALVIKLNF
ncbi:MAG: alpha-amylase family glycosyl hydrolase [Luteibaculaceae bacterium]